MSNLLEAAQKWKEEIDKLNAETDEKLRMRWRKKNE